MPAFNSQNWINTNLTDKSIKKMLLSPLTAEEISSKKEVIAVGGTLTGDLIIKDFPQLEEIGLREHELTSLTIVNCPLLKHINVRNNKLANLDISKVKEGGKLNDNEISEIIAGDNELITLDLTPCQKIKELIIPGNLKLTKIKNLNFGSVSFINLDGSPQVSLASEYEELKKENDSLYEIIREIDKAGQERPFVITEPISDPKQSELAIRRLLRDAELKLRKYFESKDEKTAKENDPILWLAFETTPILRRPTQRILKWIIETQGSGKYGELVYIWNGGKEEEISKMSPKELINTPYNPTYDFHGDLDKLMNYLDYLGIKQKIQQQVQQQQA